MRDTGKERRVTFGGKKTDTRERERERAEGGGRRKKLAVAMVAKLVSHWVAGHALLRGLTCVLSSYNSAC